MKIIVTGALGFIGSKLIRDLAMNLKDAEIHMIDNLLIPLWMKQHIKSTLTIIHNYKYRMVYYELVEIENLLPLCP